MLKVDKSKWPEGPWKYEEDYLKWIDQRTGFTCLITRDEKLGVLHLHVRLPHGHPMVNYDILEVVYTSTIENRAVSKFKSSPAGESEDFCWLTIAMTSQNDYIPCAPRIIDSAKTDPVTFDNYTALKALETVMVATGKVIVVENPPTYKDVDYVVAYSRQVCVNLNNYYGYRSN